MSEAITLKKTLIAAAVAAMANCAIAAELGSLRVFSAVGEPLNAELTVRDVDPKADQLTVRLAPASTYRRVGKEVALSLNDISLTLLRQNPYTVKIEGQQSVTAQRFPLIMELSESGKVSAKLYEVQLQNRPTVPMVKRGVEDKSVPVKNVAGNDRAIVPSVSQQTAAVTETNRVPSVSAGPSVKREAPKSTPEPTYVPPVREPAQKLSASQTKTVVRATTKSVASSPENVSVKLPLNPADYDLDKPFLVRDGMTMWSIATLYRPRYPQASMDQILVAFVRTNPDAYERGRVNGVKVGSRLKAPLADEVMSVGLDEAWALVRVAPNSDARKVPSAKLLQRARARMQKEAPALWRKWKASNEQMKSVVPVKTESKPVVKSEPPVPAAPKAESLPETESNQAPLADTLSKAEADHDAKLQTQDSVSAPAEQKTETEQSPVADKPEAVSEPAPTPVPEMPALEEKSEEGSGGFWSTLIGILVVLGAAAGGVWYWMKQRADSQRRREENMGVVKFRKAESANPEQLKGTQEMLERRLESERATLRMRQAEVKTHSQASTTVETRIEPMLGDLKQQTSSQQGFNGAPAYVGDEAQVAQMQQPLAEPSAAMPTTEVLSGKLITARTYIGIGAYAEAKQVLQEVIHAGNEEQRRQASELLTQVEKARDDQQ